MDKIKFVLCSSATHHMINNDELFTTFNVLQEPLQISVSKNELTTSATKYGTIKFVSDTGVQCTLEKVLYSKELSHNFLSVEQITKKGFTILIAQSEIKISKNKTLFMNGQMWNNLITVDFFIEKKLE